jgi:hypothetical protein
MPHHHRTAIAGKIIHVFAHRFVVETSSGAILADLTPKGTEQVAIHVGDQVKLEGEMKPSELKVTRFTRGGKSIDVEHKKHDGHGPGHEHHHGPADPAVVLKSARAAGYEPIGEPRRKPKHFEVLGRRHGELVELHVELDGHIRKTKPGAGDDHKWQAALAGARPLKTDGC